MSTSKTAGIAAATITLLLAPGAQAMPAPPFVITLHNADGTTVMGRLFGDEHLSWAEDAEGFSLAYDRADGAWHYAELDPAGELVALPHRAGSIAPNLLSLNRHLAPGPLVMERAARERAQEQTFGSPPPPHGVLRALVVFVQFDCTSGCSTVNRFPTYMPADFEPIFNGTTGSVKEYFHEVSGGKLQVESTIAHSNWIKLANNDLYYARNDVTKGKPWEMVNEAVAFLDSIGFDFTPFDGNGDGAIDAIDVVHNGPSYETTGDVHTINSQYLPLDWKGRDFTTKQGLRVTAFHTGPELGVDGKAPMAIGFPCHETGHILGLPDLYDYTFASAGLGGWSLMAFGNWGGEGDDGNRPVHMDAFSKYRLGFTSPKRIGATTKGLSLAPVESGGETLLIDVGMPNSQYFLLENRSKTGYDQALPGAGLAIYHVDDSRYASPSVGSESCGNAADKTCNNNDPAHYLVDLEQADGRRTLNTNVNLSGDATDLFPTDTADSFTPQTNPNSMGYGASSSLIHVTHISRSGDNIILDVEIDPLPQGASCAVNSDCLSSFCVDSICCNEACSGGRCGTCAKTQGALEDGTCAPLPGKDGTTCDDNSPCTQQDVCSAGSCKGTAVQCPSEGACQAPSCDQQTGACVPRPAADGTACDDGNACTGKDVCSVGVCKGAEKQCPSEGACQAPSCDQQTGACVARPAADGTPCENGGTCSGGGCIGADAGSLPKDASDDVLEPSAAAVSSADDSSCSCGLVGSRRALAPAWVLGLTLLARRKSRRSNGKLRR